MLTQQRWPAWLTCAAALAASLPACRATPPPAPAAGESAAQPWPCHVTDDRGQTVTVKAEPRRIVSLLPSHTETLIALGAGDRLVGIDDNSDMPKNRAPLPRLGGAFDTHVEAVLALRPDLVLVVETSPAAKILEQAGIPVWGASAKRFDEVFRMIADVGRLVGRTQEASALAARIHQQVGQIESALAHVPPVRVYYEVDPTPYTAAPSSFIGVLLRKAGGANVVPDGSGEFPKISPELVVAGNPSIILGASLEDVAARPGWLAIEAVRTGRVFALNPAEAKLIERPGPRMAEALRTLAQRLHPEVRL